MLALVALAGCGRSADPQKQSVQSYMRALAETDRVLKIASLQTWLADWPEARPDLRAKALSEIWNIHAARNTLSSARAWAHAELREEPSDQGRGMLYLLLFRDALDNDSRDTALTLAREMFELDLQAAAALLGMAQGLIMETHWDVDLGARLALRGAEIADSGEARAEFLDLAGWGSYLLGRGEDSRQHLEAALAELPHATPSLASHLAALYENLGEEEALLGVWMGLLERHMDLQIQARAESLHLQLGGNIPEFREKLWEGRLAGAERAPDFELMDLVGRRHQLSSFRGRVVLLNFWHPTCDDCLRVFTALKVLAPPLSEVALISVDSSHRPMIAAKVAGGQGADWILLDDDQNISGQLYDVTVFPTNLFLDQEGRVIFRIEGFEIQDERRISEIVGALIERGGN